MNEAIELELFRHRFAAVAEEMGEVLTLAGFSPNIKERRDHSCAVFDGRGEMVAQAAHIPVHLGAAPLCVKAVLATCPPGDGETVIVNDPFAGGTHLPDITLVTGVSLPGEGGELFHVATRAHHADVGGLTPGSLPPSRRIEDEGWRTGPVALTEEVVASLLAESRTPDERRGDLAAQRAANRLGRQRLQELAARYGGGVVRRQAEALQAYTARRVEAFLEELGAGEARVEDVLDDALGEGPPVRIALVMRVEGGRVDFDFRGSDPQVEGPMNAVRAIVESAVFYTLLCLVGADVPANSGVMRPVTIRTAPGTVVDAVYPAAVAAGNVETSQRLVDVCLAAFGELLPARVPAASCGSMNNVLIGSVAGASRPFVYYETNGGGHGGGPAGPGASGMQVHMTNTLNTPVEALEHAFPLRIERYGLARGTGGRGRYPGGDGLERAWRFLEPAELTVIADRRRRGPPGAMGGGDGTPGEQWLEGEGGARMPVPGKGTRRVEAGAVFAMRTPGGGGWGSEEGG
ncbi:MAG: hydantoinase B/oxoprolinase family protein [Deltaproteobacteria bacterium]|nr:MAG: hydantoinase B/oxoprolinase family protein [Deltaproteobacteria bacterium]